MKKEEVIELIHTMGCEVEHDAWEDQPGRSEGSTKFLRVIKTGFDTNNKDTRCCIILKGAMETTWKRNPSLYVARVLGNFLFEAGKISAKQELKEFFNV